MSGDIQATLFRTQDEPRSLTDRQAFTLEIVRRAWFDGLPADEVGAALCGRNGRHPAGLRCKYDRSNGLGVLHELRTKGYAKSRRDGTWHTTRFVAGDLRDESEIPF